jgi:hypothetical protein
MLHDVVVPPSVAVEAKPAEADEAGCPLHELGFQAYVEVENVLRVAEGEDVRRIEKLATAARGMPVGMAYLASTPGAMAKISSLGSASSAPNALAPNLTVIGPGMTSPPMPSSPRPGTINPAFKTISRSSLNSSPNERSLPPSPTMLPSVM